MRVGADQARARRAQRLEDDRVVDAGVMAGGERAAQHQRGGDQRDGAGAADRQHQVGHDRAERLERLLHPHRRHHRIIGGDRADERAFLGRRAAVRKGQGGEPSVRRAAEGVGREHHDEIDAEVLPIDAAQVGDAGGDVAAEHVDGDGVAELQAQPVGDAALERHQRRPVVVRLPPFAGDETRAFRHILRVGDAAVALQHPGGVLLGLQILGADAVGRNDAAAQHRHFLELGGRRLRAQESVEARGIGRTGCRGNRTTAPWPAVRRRIAGANWRRSRSPSPTARCPSRATARCSASARPAGGYWRPPCARPSSARAARARQARMISVATSRKAKNTTAAVATIDRGHALVIGEQHRERSERDRRERRCRHVDLARAARLRRHRVAEQRADRHVMRAAERPQREGQGRQQAVQDREQQFADVQRRHDRVRNDRAQRPRYGEGQRGAEQRARLRRRSAPSPRLA